MGRAKELLYEQMEQEEDEKLATLLNITYEELSQAEWHIETEESKDGLIFGYVVYFEDNSPKWILKKINGIDENNQVWLPAYAFSNEENYDYEEQFEAIIENKLFYNSFRQEILNIRQLNEVELANPALIPILKRQLYVTAIGALETFLSETFISLTNENPVYLRNFIETYPNFKESKFQLNEIYKHYGKLEETAKKEIFEVIFHNLAKIRNMFISTFKIEFPKIAELSKSVSTRHDLVHRNGKTKAGEDVLIQKETVTDLLNKISEFVEHISKSLNLNDEQEFVRGVRDLD